MSINFDLRPTECIHQRGFSSVGVSGEGDERITFPPALLPSHFSLLSYFREILLYLSCMSLSMLIIHVGRIRTTGKEPGSFPALRLVDPFPQERLFVSQPRQGHPRKGFW